MKAGFEFCRNVLLNNRRTGITHYGGGTERINQYLKNHVKSQSFYDCTDNRNL